MNLQVPQGSVFGLLGPNGAGKTSLIKMLLGLSTPTSGEIKLFGESIQKNKISLLGKVGAFIETPSAFEHLNGTEQPNYDSYRKFLSLIKKFPVYKRPHFPT
ncbi:ATP-binding cassette domain-containing protein [Peribacillus sp. NPDC096448]|uniref:ATP-binding cassette domain-containing protein n=1 Tax=Peribacillus sp. NPDC096448 TaxID=3364395 RepID=UPI00381762A9